MFVLGLLYLSHKLILETLKHEKMGLLRWKSCKTLRRKSNKWLWKWDYCMWKPMGRVTNFHEKKQNPECFGSLPRQRKKISTLGKWKNKERDYIK